MTKQQVQEIINSLDNAQDTKPRVSRFFPLFTAGIFYTKLKSFMGDSSSSKYQCINSSSSTLIGKSGNWKLFLIGSNQEAKSKVNKKK